MLVGCLQGGSDVIFSKDDSYLNVQGQKCGLFSNKHEIEYQYYNSTSIYQESSISLINTDQNKPGWFLDW